MRMLKGLENIHSVIDRHEKEWKIEQGEVNDIENIDALTLEENVRRRLTTPSNPAGRFSANRFLGAPSKNSKTESEPEPEIKTETETESENNVEVVSVIKTQDIKKNHSWLYNEVVKAINDAVGNNKNTKVVAVFVPVIQNAKEFEDLPVDSIVTMPQAVTEEEIKFSAEDLEAPAAQAIQEPEQEQNQDESFNLIPEIKPEHDEELVEAFQAMEEKLDESLQENQEAEQEPEQELELTEEIIEEEPEEEQQGEILQHEDTELEPEQVVELQEAHEEINSEEPLILNENENEPEILEEPDTKTEEIEETVEEKKEAEESEEPEEVQEENQLSSDDDLLPPLPDDLEDDEVFDDSQISEILDTSQWNENENNDNNEFRLEDVVEIIN